MATEYRLISKDFVKTTQVGSREVLTIQPEAIEQLTEAAFHDIMHFLRPTHLSQLSKILADPEASDNDRFVAVNLLENAMIAAEGIFPGCQDTGTAIVMGKKGESVWVEGEDEALLNKGILNAYKNNNFRYSQLAPLDVYTEKNTGTNLPAELNVYSTKGD